MRRIVLIACASQKRRTRARAADLYTSTLFTLSLAYARRLRPDTIFLLSAKYGLLAPDQVIEPYDMTLNDMPAARRRAWAVRVVQQLARYADLQDDQFVILAGRRYREYVVPYLADHVVPLEGMRIGEQLQYLKRAVEG